MIIMMTRQSMHVGKVGIILDQTISPNIAIKEVADSGQKRGGWWWWCFNGDKDFYIGRLVLRLHSIWLG